MITTLRLAAALTAAISLLGTGCTSILGDVTFDRTGTGGDDTTSSSSGTGGATTSSSSGTGGATTSTSTTTTSSSSGTGGATGSSSTSSSSGTGGAFTCPSGDIEYPAGSGTCITDPCKPDPCNGNGTCANGTGQAVCTCSAGWIGSSCDTCVYFVAGGATGTGDGSSWANAFTTVQPALTAASTLVTNGAPTCDVWVEAGTYYLYVSSKTADSVMLQTSVGLYGGFAGTETQRTQANPTTHPTILSGKKSATSGPSVEHVVAAYNTTGAVIDGFTLRDGDADGSGGSPEDGVGGGFLLYAYNVHGASVTVSRCEITANSAEYSGGVGTQWGSPSLTVTDCDIHGNTATYGGGGLGCADTCTVTGTTIQGNTAGTGAGGISVPSSTNLNLSGDTILDNAATGGDCGGLELDTHPAGATLSDLYIGGNYASGNGGGICNHDAASTFSNLVLVGNTAQNGGAIYSDAAAGLIVIGATITGNQGTAGNDAIASPTGTPALYNTIVWGNPDSGATTNTDSPPAGVTTSHCDIGGYAGADTTSFSANPIFLTVPLFFDRTTTLSADTGSLVVSSSAYAVGDVIEVGGDGTARAVTSIVGSTVRFLPALTAAAAGGVQVLDWGTTLGSLDLELGATSMCIDAGDAAVAAATDITGQTRVGAPDIGAYEHP